MTLFAVLFTGPGGPPLSLCGLHVPKRTRCTAWDGHSQRQEPGGRAVGSEMQPRVRSVLPEHPCPFSAPFFPSCHPFFLPSPLSSLSLPSLFSLSSPFSSFSLFPPLPFHPPLLELWEKGTGRGLEPGKMPQRKSLLFGALMSVQKPQPAPAAGRHGLLSKPGGYYFSSAVPGVRLLLLLSSETLCPWSRRSAVPHLVAVNCKMVTK